MEITQTQTNLRLRSDIKERAEKAVKTGLFPGINSLNALTDYALDKALKAKGA